MAKLNAIPASALASKNSAPPRSLVDVLFVRIEQSILSGSLAPGNKLPTEKMLAESENVSRTVVREAVARLVAQGLVISRQGSGVYVSEMATFPAFQVSPEEISGLEDRIKLLELRLALEAEMASLAALRRTFADLADLRRSLDLMIASQTSDDAVAADSAFHLAIARASQNDYYVRFLEFLGARLIPPRSLLLRDQPQSEHHAYAAAIVREHRDILEAIADQDPVRARVASRRHMQISLERHSNLFHENSRGEQHIRDAG